MGPGEERCGLNFRDELLLAAFRPAKCIYWPVGGAQSV